MENVGEMKWGKRKNPEKKPENPEHVYDNVLIAYIQYVLACIRIAQMFYVTCVMNTECRKNMFKKFESRKRAQN